VRVIVSLRESRAACLSAQTDDPEDSRMYIA
jgi:hypothetical protein